jgi:hypothetical protein
MADIEAKMTGMNKSNKTLYLKGLSAEEREKYNRFRNNERQKRYKEANREKANERSRIKMKENREQKPDKYKELNRKHNNDLNKRRKAQKTLTDAIKTRNAKKEMSKRAVEKANETARELEENSKNINEIIKEGKASIRES